MKVPISIVSTKSGRFIAAVDVEQAQGFIEVEMADTKAAASPSPIAAAVDAGALNLEMAKANDSLHQENAALLEQLRAAKAQLAAAALPEV